jgi:hypothetical protein
MASSKHGKSMMEIRASIFGSASEGKCFERLLDRWHHRLRLYPNLPLSNLVKIERNELNQGEWDFYLKSSVDYTFCDLSGRPVLSIEFDGLGGGFSAHDEYKPKYKSLDPYRKLKLDFKLKMANKLRYPLIVISDTETNYIDRSEKLTLMDGILGNFLAVYGVQDHLDRICKSIPKDTWDTLDKEGVNFPEAKDIFAENLLAQAEVESKIENDPFMKEYCCYHEKIVSRFIKQGVNISYDFPNSYNNISIATVTLYIRELKFRLSRTACMRNVESVALLTTMVPFNIAKYLTFKKSYHILQDKYGFNLS